MQAFAFTEHRDAKTFATVSRTPSIAMRRYSRLCRLHRAPQCEDIRGCVAHIEHRNAKTFATDREGKERENYLEGEMQAFAYTEHRNAKTFANASHTPSTAMRRQ